MLFFSPKFFKKLTFSKNSTRNTNGLDPDQDRHFVSPDLDPNCLQMLSMDDISPTSKERVSFHVFLL